MNETMNAPLPILPLSMPVRRVTFDLNGCPLEDRRLTSDAAAADYLASVDLATLRAKPASIQKILRCADWASASTSRTDSFCSFIEVLVSNQPLSLPACTNSLFSCLALLGMSYI